MAIGPSPGEVGEVTGELRFTTDKAQKDIREGLEQAGRETDVAAATMGDRQGSIYGKSFRNKSRAHLNELGQDLGSALRDIGGNFDFDTLGFFNDKDESRARRRGRSFLGAFFDGFQDVLSKQGKTVADTFTNIFGGPLGAFFNVSGKSPLILFLIPLFGFIITLITSVIYGLQAAISLIYLIPGLLFGVGLQAAALFFIFSGLGEVISAAFAATNAEELEKAFEGVNGEVVEFVKALLPWRDFFRQLRTDAQFAFFDALDAAKITRVLDVIRGPFAQAIVNISYAFGLLADRLLDVFASPAFATLINTLGESTYQWLLGLGPALANFIDGLNQFGVDLDGFLDWFGGQFNTTIFNWGESLKKLGEDPQFLKWIDSAKVILGDFMDFFGDVVNLVIVFVQQFIAADEEIKSKNGQGFLDTIAEFTRIFTAFLASPVGQDALEGLIYLLIFLTATFYDMVIIILLFIGAFEAFGETIGEFFRIVGGLGQFFSDLGSLAQDAWFALRLGLHEIAQGIGDWFSQLGTNFNQSLANLISFVVQWVADLDDKIFEAGKTLITRLGDGIKDAMPGLAYILDGVGALINSFFNHSPAEQGPLAGRGDPLYAGQEFVNRIAAGIEMQSPELSKAVNNASSNVVFDPGAIQVNYYGTNPPSRAQANAMGQGVGQGLVGALTATQMAVRTM